MTANYTGTVSYNVASETFVATAEPLSIKTSPGIFVPGRPIQTPSDFRLEFKVDSTRRLISGFSGDDFTVSGSIDIDDDGLLDSVAYGCDGQRLAVAERDGRLEPNGYQLSASRWSTHDAIACP